MSFVPEVGCRRDHQIVSLSRRRYASSNITSAFSCFSCQLELSSKIWRIAKFRQVAAPKKRRFFYRIGNPAARYVVRNTSAAPSKALMEPNWSKDQRRSE